jgi:RimJ/RimL family protein N-acetyltransferase
MEIALRAVEEADLPVLFEHQRDPEANRMAAFPARDRDAFVAHWRGILVDEGVIARTILADGQVVGDILSWVDDERRLVGYWIGREHWGRGIATRALAAFAEEVTIRPLYAKVAVHNAGSIRVLEKCGFVRRGEPERGDDGIVDLLYVLERSGASHSAG